MNYYQLYVEQLAQYVRSIEEAKAVIEKYKSRIDEVFHLEAHVLDAAEQRTLYPIFSKGTIESLRYFFDMLEMIGRSFGTFELIYRAIYCDKTLKYEKVVDGVKYQCVKINGQEFGYSEQLEHKRWKRYYSKDSYCDHLTTESVEQYFIYNENRFGIHVNYQLSTEYILCPIALII